MRKKTAHAVSPADDARGALAIKMLANVAMLPMIEGWYGIRVGTLKGGVHPVSLALSMRSPGR